MDAIVDYAFPCMMAENALKKAHNAMLDKNYDEAMGETLTAIAESRLMYNAIKYMKEQEWHTRKNQDPTSLSTSNS